MTIEGIVIFITITAGITAIFVIKYYFLKVELEWMAHQLDVERESRQSMERIYKDISEKSYRRNKTLQEAINEAQDILQEANKIVTKNRGGESE